MDQMNQEELQHKRELRQRHKRRLRYLELQQANEGNSTDPAINIEIEDIRQKIGIVEKEIEDLEKAEIRKLFIGLFCNNDDNHRCAIIIPSFPAENVVIRDDGSWESKINKTLVKKKYEFNRAREYYLICKFDNDAAYYIMTLFGNYMTPLPHLIYDTNEEEKNFDGNFLKDTYSIIIIGTTSNAYYQKVVADVECLFEIRDDPIMGRVLKLTDSNKQFSEEDKGREYALISRIRNGGRTYLIIGGNNAQGTQYLGLYLRDNWMKFFTKCDPQTNKAIENNVFAAVVSFGMRGTAPRIEDIRVP